MSFSSLNLDGANGSVPRYPNPNPDLHGLVDIGSNGIRFSISNLASPTTRVMPTVFQDRAPISLYDAQYVGTSKAPIAEPIIRSVVKTLVRFQHICTTFGVLMSHIRVVATEATREAQNSFEFREAIEEATGWKVELLSKADEGKIGAWGVASSLNEISGLVMDLGGGSTQLSWLVSREGETQIAPEPVSLPYGAAALTKRMETAINEAAVERIRYEMKTRLVDAFNSLQLPEELLAKKEDGFNLYLSGGGFRGFGYLLLEEHEIQPYPLPIINGFSAPGSSFLKMADFHLTAKQTHTLNDTFRISERRARQIPAVAFLVNTLMEILPKINSVIFCQGGVREGALFSTLPKSIRKLDPLEVATQPFAAPAAREFIKLMEHALPKSAPREIRRIVRPLANIMLHHSNIPKESRASCGLHSTTTGVLASVHGLTHRARALLALALCQRWGGEVSDTTLKQRLSLLVGSEMEFWCRYLGAVAGVIGSVYPAGVMVDSEERVRFFGEDRNTGEKQTVLLRVRFCEGDPLTDGVMVGKEVEAVEKVGKKKRCGTFRRKVEVVVARDLDA
ncbi:Ppx/GppA phosphatase family-domain-containing protein [Tricharina praecox]|uniref:Ppx/GppA phosphatase family-domain-containing protein n=1 Tax=Tricharina praecox TaxID=43433 RepID=UPI00221FEC5F|nr:Ppx/GppA phosphatase family-domain-containing protein [Tricharina praecox]KAI5853569.1 Ppx/GppA phosphatase family-domain-containing protein [Tricharina praecox]